MVVFTFKCFEAIFCADNKIKSRFHRRPMNDTFVSKVFLMKDKMSTAKAAIKILYALKDDD